MESAPRLRWTLSLLLLTLFSLTSWAGGGVNNARPESDDVTAMPIVQDTAGLTFLGSAQDMRALVISLQGRGRIDVLRVGPNTFAVTLVGDYQVVLDRAVLARSTVPVVFRGGAPFDTGLAMLQIGSSSPMLLAPDRVPLFLARLADSPRAQGDLLTLDVFGPRGKHAHVDGHFSPDLVTLTQRSN